MLDIIPHGAQQLVGVGWLFLRKGGAAQHEKKGKNAPELSVADGQPSVYCYASERKKKQIAGGNNPPDVQLPIVKSLSGSFSPAFLLSKQQIAWAGPDDGGIHRGDREDTGDNQAAPEQGGYEPAPGTAESETADDGSGPDRDYYDGMQ